MSLILSLSYISLSTTKAFLTSFNFTIMKKLLLPLLILFSLSSLTAYAQTEAEITAARKGLKGKSYKTARKEAKRLKKEGYINLPGQLPVSRQLERSYAFTYALDDKGRNKYFVETQEAKAETFAAAEQQARQLCLANIASEIGSNILGRVKANIANAESVADATSVTEVVGAYQNTVMARLGRTNPVVSLKKLDKKNGLTYVYMTLVYDLSSAEEMVKADLRKALKEETQLLQEEIDQLLNFN